MLKVTARLARSVSSQLNRAAPSSSSSSLAGVATEQNRRERRRHREEQEQSRQQQRFRWVHGAPLLGLSWLVTVKDVLGIEPLRLDKDPLKEKVKQSWLHRKYGRYTEAIQVLEIALEEANERKEELPITRVYDEMANTYYQKGDLEEAEKYFRIVINRLMSLHGKKDVDPEFIGVSLKFADIFAQVGRLDDAESGYKHCVKKQMQTMEAHMRKFSVAHGALVEDKHLVDSHGAAYTDPIALFGMALEAYAHFLITYRDEDRLREAEEYMDEVMKISYQIYGSGSYHSVSLLNNVGAALIMRHRFELARKYLAVGIDRILYVNECADMLPGYYCNYAEALFHTGHKEEALEFARKAVTLSRSEQPRIQKYCQQFLKDLEKDTGKGTKKTWWLF